MQASSMIKTLQGLIAPQVEKMGFELWGLECLLAQRNKRICVYIDRAEGVTLDDCAAVSDQLSGVLDVADLALAGYRLEISSPGLDRLLMCPEHFSRYQGSMATLRLYQPMEGRRRLIGTIRSADDAAVEIEEGGEVQRVPYQVIARARLRYEEEKVVSHG